MPKSPKVFISYSHVDNIFEQKMLSFANKLRSDGIDADIDLYNPVPFEGWPRWMEKQILNSDYIIVVCSESYWNKIYNSNGKGVIWEVNMVYQMLYDEHCNTSKFIPVFWNEDDKEENFHVYQVDEDDTEELSKIWTYKDGRNLFNKIREIAELYVPGHE